MVPLREAMDVTRSIRLRELQHRPFRIFFIGRSVSLLGSAMGPVALALALLVQGASAVELGVVLAAQVVPHLALSLLGGAIADRRSRRSVLVVSNVGAGLAQAGVAAVLIGGQLHLGALIVLSFVGGSMGAFLSPAQRGIVPELLPASDIVAGNSLLASAQSATRIVGPTAASLIVVSFGGGWAVALDALSYLVAGAVMARLPRSGRITAPARRLRADLAEGWSTFSHTRWILVTTVCIGLMNVITAGPWQILGPLLTQSNYGATTWGFALSCRAAGLLVMSLVMYRTSFTYLLRVSLLWGSLGGATLLALGLGQPIAIVLVLAFVSGAIYSLQGIAWESSLQQHVPPQMLSRISSYDEVVSYTAIPVGQLLVGPLAEQIGAATVTTWSAVLYGLASLAPLMVRQVRTLGAAQPSPAS